MCWGKGLIGVPGRGGPGSLDLGGVGAFPWGLMGCCRGREDGSSGLLGVKLLGLGAMAGLPLGGCWGGLEAMFGGPWL